MAITRRTFFKGKMNKSVDERVLPDGEYRHAENVLVQNSEGSEEGSVQNSYSNKQLTNIDFGTNAVTLGNFSCEKTDSLYWFVVSSVGTFLMEYKIGNNTTSIILKDTRPIGSRVLDIKADSLITGINKIVTDDPEKDLFSWTDDNIEPCCINIERAKTWGENGFEKEDIYVIKAYPKYPLDALPITIGDSSNNLLTKFLTFAYRYKFLDGEYSAPSDFVNYQFIPKQFDLDFYTLDNKGMENSFNAIKITFNTGKRQVTDVQVLMKESNSNNIYIIETFNKQKESWTNEIFKHFIFTHNKIYTILPEDEVYRTFDNVPLKAKSQTLIGNRLVYGNYVEGRDIIDAEGKKINISFDLSLINENVDDNQIFTNIFPLSNQIQFTNPDLFELKKLKKIIISFVIKQGSSDSYEGTFYYVLPDNYLTLNELFATDEFADFLELINADFISKYTFEMPSGFQLKTNPIINYSLVLGIPTFTITPLLIEEISNLTNVITHNFNIDSESYLILNDLRNSTSLKSNRDYQIAVIYMDEFGRKTTALTCLNNTIFVPQLYSSFKNFLRIRLNNAAPQWAKTYKFVVKAPILSYQTIYINRYYNEDFYVWAKLEADNKDKIKIGDILIIKKGPEAIIKPIEVKVLDIKFQDEDFITGNTDTNGNPIVEESGFYMKIRPEGFSMDFDDYKIYQDVKNDVNRNRGSFPVVYLDLFTNLSTTPHLDIPIPSGSTVNLFFKSFFKYDSGWREIIYSNTFVAQTDYATIEDFMLANVINKNLFANDSFGGLQNYKTNVSLQRGIISRNTFGGTIFIPNPNGKLYLKVIGLESGGTRNRGGYIDAKIVVRSTDGFYAFETEPKQDIDTNIFYESEQIFDILDGNHQANNQNQDFQSNIPAIIDLNFFNCYSQGNGVESYRIRDAFNTKHLNIDLKPTAATIESYKQVRRFADITYSEPFVESSNLNSLNEFNLSKANFKELDKDYGSIQKLYSRQNDLLVLQEDIASKVLYGKDALYSGDGEISITSIPSVLGQQILYNGYNGISLNPESFGVNKYQIYYSNAKRGTVHRLSIDGDTEISNFGMNDYFRDLFIQKPYAKKLGCFDPYHKQYVLSIGEEQIRKNKVNCGNNIILTNLTELYSYDFELNELEGDIILNYNITEGNANISINFDGINTIETNLSGVGTIIIPRTTIDENLVSVQINPSNELPIEISILHNCPIGYFLELNTIILSDELDAGKTITNRHKWSTNMDYENEYLLTSGPVTLFEKEIGVEGVGKFPRRGNIVKLESYKNKINTGRLDVSKCNRLGYLVTTSNYLEADLEIILSEATFLTITSEVIGTNSFKEFGNFLFNRLSLNENLYLIWDYTNRKPLTINDSIMLINGLTANILPKLNDSNFEGYNIEITGEPINGTTNIVGDTIIYENNGILPDIIQYKLSNGTCESNISSITINQDSTCLCLLGGSFKGIGFDVMRIGYIDCFNNSLEMDINLPENPNPGNIYGFTIDNVCVKNNSVYKISGAGNLVSFDYGLFCTPTFRSINISTLPTLLSNCEGANITVFDMLLYYNINQSISLGVVLYYDNILEIPVSDKDTGWIHISIYKSIKLNNLGVIIDIIDCTP